MILYCVRHGESTFNAAGRIQGQLDTPLSELGRQQSAALAAAFAGEPIEAVFSSPLSRAQQTAEPIAAALGLSVRLDERLRELHAGVFQGLLPRELDERYPEAARRWRAHDPDFRIPEGESRRDLMLRGRAALEAIRATDLGRVVVVSHGGLLTAALKALLEIPAERQPFMFYNASISRLEWLAEPKLLTLNDLAHLRRDGAAIESRTGDL
jgi:probable phosphoglycerate mutase